jgi:hypothetical protein
MRLITDIRVLQAERGAALEHDLDLRLPHPRGRLARGAGDRVHLRQRHRVRGRARSAPGSTSTSSRRGSPSSSRAHNDLFEEVAKFRAARRLWARLMRERFGATRERQMLRFHTQTGGVDAHGAAAAEQRGPRHLQALAAVLGGTQSLHTNSTTRRSRCRPRRRAIALRTQQVIAHESGVADTIDPLAGSYYVEALTAAGPIDLGAAGFPRARARSARLADVAEAVRDDEPRCAHALRRSAAPHAAPTT